MTPEKPFILMVLIFSIIFFGVGVLICLFPYRTQNLAIRNFSKYNRNRYFDISSYDDWIKSRSYVIFIRIMGILFIFIGAIVFYLIMKEF